LQQLIKRGAEADIYLIEWIGNKAISKVRAPKSYRYPDLDQILRRQRTIHEANFISAAKKAGVRSPFIYFVDPKGSEIIMEFVEGKNVRDIITGSICREIGVCCALLHSARIVHGDLTTSNFILVGKKLVLLDFGLAYYSERTEDFATDIRLIKEVLGSAHVDLRRAFESFVGGYESVSGKKKGAQILETVRQIERRGRYARVT
jgi:TP53 regulating kinase-like protein